MEAAVVPVEEGSPPAKKRRIPKACAACRKSKVRCDEKRPCTRCVQTATTCTWHERLKDPTEERLEVLEHAVAGLNQRLDMRGPVTSNGNDSSNGHQTLASPLPDQSRPLVAASTDLGAGIRGTGLANFTVRPSSTVDIVSSGRVSEDDARSWFHVFFQGCNRFVPIFDPTYDDYQSVKRRSNILFDVLIIYGCRAAEGSLSKTYQSLYQLVRQHTSELALRYGGDSLESVQALLVLASYSDSGGVLCDIALRGALNLDLPARVTSLFTSLATSHNGGKPLQDQMSFASARTWYGLFVLDEILSLDGGKPPSISLRSSPQRVRALLAHPSRTPLDVRLFAQVELNAMRSASYEAVVAATAVAEQSVAEAISGGVLDLDIWLSDWQAIVSSSIHDHHERETTSLNLRIQHAWAVLALQLRALTACGIENIALMTTSERSIANAAKVAAERHLQLLLVSTSFAGVDLISATRPYIANFRYAMEFVWAKNAFCVLIALRLAILLGDPVPAIARSLHTAREFLGELERVGMGANVSYTRILAQTVNKCAAAVAVALRADASHTGDEQSNNIDGDFQSFLPKEFMFEWDFPGLHLCYIPLDWQDLFLDFGATA